MDESLTITAKDIPDDLKSILAGLYESLHENGVSGALFFDSLLKESRVRR